MDIYKDMCTMIYLCDLMGITLDPYPMCRLTLRRTPCRQKKKKQGLLDQVNLAGHEISDVQMVRVCFCIRI